MFFLFVVFQFSFLNHLVPIIQVCFSRTIVPCKTNYVLFTELNVSLKEKCWYHINHWFHLLNTLKRLIQKEVLHLHTHKTLLTFSF